MAFCPTCGTQIADGATCPKCAGGTSGGGATTTAPGLTDNLAGMLAYITIIPAIIFLVLEPYNKRRFIRFHSLQCIFFAIALFILGIALSILSFIPFAAFVTIPLHFLLGVGGLIVWVILLLKAYQGQMFKLPVIGDMAEKQAGAA